MGREEAKLYEQIVGKCRGTKEELAKYEDLRLHFNEHSTMFTWVIKFNFVNE